jgi:TolB-like protein/class 3 adenylate cyclase/Flp pilus assembly protein TadD
LHRHLRCFQVEHRLKAMPLMSEPCVLPAVFFAPVSGSSQFPSASNIASAMASEPDDSQVEIAHVLFIDIVGYSKRPGDEQKALVNRLSDLVRSTDQFQRAEAAGKLIRLPTGDGMALAFFTAPDAPVRCAIEINKADRQDPRIELRMGIHSGPVDRVSDVNDRTNVTGAAINMAQRVMDCADAGHILLSKRIAEDLSHHSRWRTHLHPLGEIEVKHGARIEIVNFYGDGFGNEALPAKISQKHRASDETARVLRKRWRKKIAIGAVLLAAMAMGVSIFVYRTTHRRSATALASDKSVAVLPFENLSADPENAFFADGIQDDVLTSLAKVGDLKVISRTSVMQYRGAGKPRNLREIAQALGVANILEGSVRRAGNRALINVQLIDARNDRPIWAERYDRTIADSIGLQGELATEIATALKAKLAPEEKVRLASKPTTNPEAYLLYLRAIELSRTGASKEAAFATDELFAKAVELDPNFALAIARRSIWNGVMYQVGRRPENKATALALAAQALQLSPDLPEAHVALGLCFYRIEKNYEAALREFSSAAAAAAVEPDVLFYTAATYCRQGRWREGLASYDRAQELDPRQPHGGGPRTRAMLRDWAGAVAGFQRLLTIAPNDIFITTEFAAVSISPAGDFAVARKLLAAIPPGLHGAPGQPSMIDVRLTQTRWEINMLARDYAAAEKVLADYKGDKFLEEPLGGVKAFDAAQTALARGDVDSARSLFEQARSVYEENARRHPDDAESHAPLALLYAYLGRKDEAIRESLRAVELVPESKDAQGGPVYATNLALVYARTGEIDQAITLIERLLTTPNAVTLTDLRLSWEWDPLRSNPRFQKILEGPEPKTIY